MLTFSWMNPIMRVGARGDLRHNLKSREGNLYPLHATDDCRNLVRSLDECWQNEMQSARRKHAAQSTAAAAAAAASSSSSDYSLLIDVTAAGEQTEAQADAEDGTDDGDGAPLETASFARALRRAFGAPFICAAGLKFMYDTLKLCGPQLLKALINFLSVESGATSRDKRRATHSYPCARPCHCSARLDCCSCSFLPSPLSLPPPLTGP